VVFVMDRMALSQIFIEDFGFPLPAIILPMLHTFLSPGTGTIGLFETAVPGESAHRTLRTKTSS
jgi:hypothetical protein